MDTIRTTESCPVYGGSFFGRFKYAHVNVKDFKWDKVMMSCKEVAAFRRYPIIAVSHCTLMYSSSSVMSVKSVPHLHWGGISWFGKCFIIKVPLTTYTYAIHVYMLKCLRDWFS